MKTQWKRALVALTLAVAVGVAGVSLAQAQNQASPTGGPTTHHHEAHPAIHRAIKALEEAKVYMEHADHDFGGHRKQALEDCEKAIHQLRLALQTDKK